MTEENINKNIAPSSIETIDAAFFEYVESLNLFCTTFGGWQKVPVIWASAERAYQIKNDREIRDKNGSLIPPIISVERTSTSKDPNNKGSFQASLSPGNDRYVYAKELNQDKTSNFANADTKKLTGQINFVTSKKNKKQVYKFYSVPIPVYVTVEYKIAILTNYQAQMNEIIQPLMSRKAQNYFIISKDGHRYECFMDESFNQNSIADLSDNERKFESQITVKVLGYLIGEGNNQEKPQVIEQENAVDIKLSRENLSFMQEEPKKQKEAPSLIRNGGKQQTAGIAIKKTFVIGNGTDSIYIINHNMTTRDLFMTVRENSGQFSYVAASISSNDLNSITVDMNNVIPVDSYTVTLIG